MASTALAPAAMAIRGGEEEEMASTLTHRLSGEVDELQRMTMESRASWKRRFHGGKRAGDGGLLGGNGRGACSALSELARRGNMGETNKRAVGRVASSWRRWPDRWGQRWRTATTWPPRPDDVGQLAGLNRPSETAETD